MYARIIGTALAVQLAAPVAGLAQEPRSISGELSYLQRIALPPDALVLVDLVANGVVIAEERQTTGNRQVPVEFAIEGLADTEMTLRAQILSGARPIWTAEPVAIAAGAGALALELPPMQQSADASGTLKCGPATVIVAAEGAGAVLWTLSERLDLTEVASASGAKYQLAGDETTFFWNKGNEGLLSLRGSEAACRAVIPAPLFPLQARGNEPGWNIVADQGSARYLGNFGEVEIEGPTVLSAIAGGGARLEIDGKDVAVELLPLLCRDDATGMPHPMTATLTTGGQVLSGCGGLPISLLVGGEWALTEVAGVKVAAEPVPSLNFDAFGRVYGMSGCNRFAGGYSVSGEGVSIGMGGMAGTMMACEKSSMALEQEYLAALAKVTGFDISQSGELLLTSGEGVALRLAR